MSKQQSHFKIVAPKIARETCQWVGQVLEIRKKLGVESAEKFVLASFDRSELDEKQKFCIWSFLRESKIL